MSLASGARVGPYEILSPLGAGGMGEVYRARDTRLSREAAVKVLPPELSGDTERLARFGQEARSASALNHPNIVTIYDVGSTDSVSYIAMELVEGKTLRELLASGPLPARRLLPIAAQIADGLAKAHESGIVHRDLKPENVMINKDGFAKILDFGLAKLAAPSGSAESQLATLAGPGTRPGMVMGTVGYMSPEQASGEAVDFRSDQFSLGSILYEMAAGVRAFQKKTAIETLSAIIRDDPEPIAAVNPQAPAPLRWIVERCLSKEPENRYAATRDLARDLKQTLDHLSETSLETPAMARSRKRPGIGWAAVAAVVGAAVVGLAVGKRIGSGSAKPPAALRQLTFGSGLEDEPAFSPDAKFLAYATDERGHLDVVVQPLGGGEPIRVAATDADAAQPAWSPDGTRIAFVSARDHGGRLTATLSVSALEAFSNSGHGDVFLAPALGGAAVKLVEDGYYPSWSPDGKRIAFMSNRDDGVHIWTVSAEGGAPVRLTPAGPDIDYQPVWSPDGRWIAYGAGRPARGSQNARFNVFVVPAGGGAPSPITEDFVYTARPAWAADSRSIVFAGDQNGIMNLWRVPLREGRRSGPLARVTLGPGQDTGATISRDGRLLAFSTVNNDQNVWELTVDSGVVRPVTHGGSADYAHLSPDGKTLLVSSNQTGSVAIWTADLQGRFLTRLTPGQTLEPEGRWSRDGGRIAWVKEGGILQIQPVGSMSAVDTGVPTGAVDWSPDGRRIALGTAQGSSEVRVYDLDSKSVKVLTSVNQLVDFPSWSPDGKRIAFQLQRGSIREIWVVASDGGAATALTKDLEDSHPAWSPVDPDTILFLRDHQRMALVSVSTGKVRLLPGTPEGSCILDYPTWSPDGKKIYYTVSRKTGNLFLLEGF